MAAHSVVLATAGYDHSLKFWEATSGRCTRSLQFSDSHVNRLEVSPGKELVAAAGNPSVRLFDINGSTSQPVASLDATGGGNVTALCFDRSGRWLFTGSEDGTVRVWDARHPSQPQRELASRGAITSLALHPNQAELLSSDQHGNVRCWDLTTGACTCELVPEVNVAVRCISVASDGSLAVAANNNGTCFVWNLSCDQHGHVTGFEPQHRLQAHDDYILRCSVSPDVRSLATASADTTLKLWSMRTFELLRTFEGHTRWVWDCVFSVDAAYIVTASSDTTACLWDSSSGEPIRTYSGHQKALTCCALNDSALDS
jgi:G protein beta subunit-like protein